MAAWCNIATEAKGTQSALDILLNKEKRTQLTMKADCFWFNLPIISWTWDRGSLMALVVNASIAESFFTYIESFTGASEWRLMSVGAGVA